MAIQLGEALPRAAYLALGVLTMTCLKHIFIESSSGDARHSQCSLSQPTSVVYNFLILLSCLAVCLTWLKASVFPRLIAPNQFPKSWDNDKYYGFAAQVSYHCAVVCGFLVVLVFHGRKTGGLYRMLTLAEPAYCTFDVLLFMLTGVSFTNWGIKPLLVHHMISCACTHALVYGIPCSVYGIWLQLVIHMTSAVCLGIANVVATPSFNLKPAHKVSLQIFALLVFGIVRVFLFLVLGVSLILDAQQLAALDHRRLVTMELAIAAAASMLFVVIKTPVLVHGLRSAVQEYERESVPESLGMSKHVEARAEETCAEADLNLELDDGVERPGIGDLVAEIHSYRALAQRRSCSRDCSEISSSDNETDVPSASDDDLLQTNSSSRESSCADLVSMCNVEHHC